jgi:hypothetical protein
VSSAHLLKWRPVEVVILPKEFGRLDFVVSVGLIKIPRCQMDTSVDLLTARNVACILIPAERVSVMNVEISTVSKKVMKQLRSVINVRKPHLKSALVEKKAYRIYYINVSIATIAILVFVMISMTIVMIVLKSSQIVQNGSNTIQ